MSLLIDSLATTDSLSALFADVSVLQTFLDVEASLAAAEARAGVIPEAAARSIRRAAQAHDFDAAAIAAAARASGTIAIPIVQVLTAKVKEIDPDGARFVHYGATSQDIVDTALVLLLNRARTLLAADEARLVRDLRMLSDRHARSIMLARTLLQPAPPITFGLKAAHWAAAVARSWTRASKAFDDIAVVQFGGASGTLAAFGERALDVRRQLAAELALGEPPAPWHGDRDRVGALVTALALHAAALGKIARDVSLLMQDEIGEAAEPGGGSSTMPHKRNPAGCAIALAAAVRMPGLAASCLAAMVQEHERGVGGWHAEWPLVASTVQTAGAALAALADAAADLTVSPERMRANLERTNGAVFAERLVILGTPRAGKEAAQALAAAALARSRETGVTLGAAVKSLPEAPSVLTPDQIASLDLPEAYLGAAEDFRRALLAEL